MKKLCIICLFIIVQQLIAQSDFFPLAVGNRYSYIYRSQSGDYGTTYTNTDTDTGDVFLKVIDVVETPTEYTWSVDEVYNFKHRKYTWDNLSGTRDTIYSISGHDVFLVHENKSGMHVLTAYGVVDIWHFHSTTHPITRYDYNADTICPYIVNDHGSGVYDFDDTILLRLNTGLQYTSQKSNSGSGHYYSSYLRKASLVWYDILNTARGDEPPLQYFLSQNYPNPFNPSTTIPYSIPIAGRVKISIYDVLGNTISTLIDENKPAGEYWIYWNSDNQSSGTYFYRIQSGRFSDTKKMILMR